MVAAGAPVVCVAVLAGGCSSAAGRAPAGVIDAPKSPDQRSHPGPDAYPTPRHEERGSGTARPGSMGQHRDPARDRERPSAVKTEQHRRSPGAPKNADQGSLLSSLPGTLDQTCVAIKPGLRTVRAGQLALGDFVEAQLRFRKAGDARARGGVSLYVIPLHPTGQPLTVVVTSPSGTRVRVKTAALEEAGDWKYYPLQVPVNRPGRWRLDASAGQDRGCVLVTFGR